MLLINRFLSYHYYLITEAANLSLFMYVRACVCVCVCLSVDLAVSVCLCNIWHTLWNFNEKIVKVDFEEKKKTCLKNYFLQKSN